MLTAQLNYLDASLIILVLGLLLSQIGMQRKTKRRIAEIEKHRESLANYQNTRANDLESELALLKETLLEKEGTLRQEINELSKKNDLRFEEMDGVIFKVDNKMDPLRDSLSETIDKVDRFQESVVNMIRENGEGIQRLEKEIRAISEEIENMKDLIQGRVIDVEL